MVALACWAVVVVGGRGWLPFPVPGPEIVLAPAAVALALSAGLGRVAFESDLPGYRLGLRQVGSLLAASALVAGVVPVAVAALDGQWLLPRHDLGGLLVFTKGEKAKGSFRILWAGDPEALPFDGWHLSDGLAYGTTIDGAGDATGLWPAPDDGATHLLADGLGLATSAHTSRLGHLLAPMAVRYIVVPRRVAPAAKHVAALPVPPALTRALDSQIDLRPVESDDSLVVYENAAWIPGRALLTTAAARQAASRGALAAEQTDLAGSRPALTKGAGTFAATGPVRSGDRVFVSQSSDARWQLTSGGRAAARADAFGWANQFSVSSSGHGRLHYRTPATRYLSIVIELALWLLAVRHVATARRHDRDPSPQPAQP
jgi:hypothetical protein